MNKKIKMGLLVFALLIAGTIGVSAAVQSQVIATYNNHSISSGGSKSYSGLLAKYAYGMVGVSPLSINSGTKKTTIVGKSYSGGSLTNTVTKTVNLYDTATSNANLGNLGISSWTITNRAYGSDGDYAGWSGILQVISKSA